MFKLTTPLVPLASDGGGAELPPIDQRPFKPAGEDNKPPKDTGPFLGIPGLKPTPPKSTPRVAPQPPAPDMPRDPAIDAMVAQWLQEGWLYVHAPSGEYRTRDRRWREQTEDEKSWS